MERTSNKYIYSLASSFDRLTIVNVSGAKITELQCKKAEFNWENVYCSLFFYIRKIHLTIEPCAAHGINFVTHRNVCERVDNIYIMSWTIFPAAGVFLFFFIPFLILSIDKLCSFPKFSECHWAKNQDILQLNGCTEALVRRKIDYCLSDRRQSHTDTIDTCVNRCYNVNMLIFSDQLWWIRFLTISAAPPPNWTERRVNERHGRVFCIHSV